MSAKLFTNVFTRFCFFSEKPSIFSIKSWYFRYKWSWFCSVCLSFESLGLFIAKSVSNETFKAWAIFNAKSAEGTLLREIPFEIYESGKFTSVANSLRVFPVYSSSLSTFFQKLMKLFYWQKVFFTWIKFLKV